MLLPVHFDPDNCCDACGKALLVSTEPRTRCDQCVRYGAPQDITPPVRVIGGQGGTGAPCTVCGNDKNPHGDGPIVLVEDTCVGCLLDAATAARTG